MEMVPSQRNLQKQTRHDDGNEQQDHSVQVYVNMGSRIYREVDIYCPRLRYVWHSRKRKSTTKIELMDENEEMWDDDEDEVVDKDGVDMTMVTDTNVGGSQKRRNRKKLLSKIKSYLPT